MLISKLERQRKAAQKAGKKKNLSKNNKIKQIAAKNKCWPMRGQIISRYGRQRHSVLKTVTRNLGIEIKGQRSSSVKAAAPGVVAMVTSIQGHGQGIIVDHGGSYYTVYAHLANIRVKEGDEIRRCQEMGNPSDEDSMNGVKLYFQVTEGTQTKDPLKWLEKAR